MHCIRKLVWAFFLSAGLWTAPSLSAATPWPELLTQHKQALDRLVEIRSSVQQASPEQRQKLINEFQQVVKQVRTEIVPQLEQQLPAELAAHPDDPQVGEVADEILQLMYMENRFEDCQKLSDLVHEKRPTDQLAANFAGIARFANHQFSDAAVVLQQASDKGLLIDDLGGRYLQDSKNYVDYWNKEQAIRAQEAAAVGDQQLPQVRLKTTRGDIVLELFEDQAPNTVANFINLVEKDYYNDLLFHRVIPDFMIQGGCPNTRQGPSPLAGTGGPGYNILCESGLPDARRHFSGTLSMAHAGKDTGGSQFFITHLPTPHLDPGVNKAPHTVFGRVVEGLDVVRGVQQNDKIISATVVRKRNHDYVPKTLPETR